MIALIITLLTSVSVLLYLLYKHADKKEREEDARWREVDKEEQNLQDLKDIGIAEEVRLRIAKLHNKLDKLRAKVKSTLNKNQPTNKE